MAILRAWNSHQGESGYILITAVWLLLLGASIVSLLMLKNTNRGETISYEREQIGLRYAQESAIETVVADMLFNGPRGDFAQLPAENTYRFEGRQVNVRVTSESGKIDVNQADIALIDKALRGFAIPSLQRQNFIDTVRSRRARGGVFQSVGDVESVLQKAGIANSATFCASQFFTVFSGLSSPQPAQMDAALSRALGQPNARTLGKTRTGAAFKILVSSDDGIPLSAIVRVSGLVGESHSVLDWQYGNDCSQNG